jgi:recombination protein RecT
MSSTALATIASARQTLDAMKPQMALALPPHVNIERLCRVIMNAFQTTPALLNCDRNSFMKAAMTVAVLGLEPEGVLGQAYLVPYKGQVQAQIGYKGLTALARNSGQISTLVAHEVCTNDTFDYEWGLNERLEHKPADGERGELTHVYAVAKFKDGSHHFEVLTKTEVDRIKAASPSASGNYSPWKTHYTEMAKKTAIRRIAKYLPLFVQRADAVNAAAEMGKVANLTPDDQIIDIEPDEVTTDETDGSAQSQTSKLDAFEAGLAGDDSFPGDTPTKADAGTKKTAA